MASASARHGWREPSAERKDELLRRFRAVDTAVFLHLRDEAGPLVLAGVGYYHPIPGGEPSSVLAG